MAYEEIKLTRRDMARAEISAAIDLFIINDPVPAHVLAFSAKAILRGVAKAHKVETFDDILEKHIKPELIKRWRSAIADSYNAFKHANEDPDRELENFRPETTAIAIFMAVVNYGLIYKQRTVSMNLFFGWFMSRYPDFALFPMNESVQKWSGSFDHPEGKPLSIAIKPLGAMIGEAKQHLAYFLAELPPEFKQNLEI